MIKFTDAEPVIGWHLVTLTLGGNPVETPGGVRAVLGELFPDRPLAVRRVRLGGQAVGDWYVELPPGVLRVWDTQGYLDLGTEEGARLQLGTPED